MAEWRACPGGCSSAWGAAEAGIVKAGACNARAWAACSQRLSVQQTFGVGVQFGQGVALLYYACVSFSLSLLNELYAWSLLALFVHFYIDGYVRKPRDRINVKKRA